MVSVPVSASKPTPLAKGLPTSLDFPGKSADEVTIAQVKKALAASNPKFVPARQGIALKGEKKLLSDGATLSSVGWKEGGELAVKDLGAQISWTTVFVIEYIGPLIVHPLMYHFPKLFYGQDVQHSSLQKYVYAMVMAHFLKREYESLFVHRYSHGTMPFAYVFRNSFHYHVLGGVALAYSVYSPTYSATSAYIRGTIRENPQFLLACAAVWLWAELSNLKTHLILRDLRPAGTTTRAIPFGYGFGTMTCPNYFFEIVGWLVVCGMTGSYSAWFFLLAGTYMMGVWAIKKHKNYKKEFGKDYPKRYKMIPFVF
ncbi:3-oxo-5-alpha-steroid 4-dehydrogenase-domain-containing protein [Phanerochaete sordida]|uniref:3-oxo-5-alpha-steroid 4-dehydrogenase-domain-containing protein n=1 Tax=Phanerochaete sordida TaxID=48140 RepID=A0A9P3L9B7_9APHY|nr:3-oxo-5-alpha-steroid 4-dehydrogenase-domain-containing protein [Phanerochaete sordida]